MKSAAALFLGMFLSTAVFAGPNRPVNVGQPQLDACPGSALTTSTTTLFVHNPQTGFEDFKSVNLNMMVMVCDYETGYNGDYVGIIVNTGRIDCGLNNIQKRQPYTGPCISGWVKKQYLEGIAGGGF